MRTLSDETDPGPAFVAEVERGGYNLLVGFDYSPGRPGVRTLPNGDPGYPEDPAEISLCYIHIEGDQTGIDLIGILEDCGGLESIEEACEEWITEQVYGQAQDDAEERFRFESESYDE